MKFIELVKEVKKNPSSLNKVDIFGRNIVLFTSNEVDSFKFLKEQGVKLNQFDLNYQTVLTPLVENNNIEVVEYLLKDEAFDVLINFQDHKEKTPIFYAKTPEMLDLLIKYGADIHIVDEDCRSLIHKEWKKEDLPLLQKIIELGVDVNERDGIGNTAIFYQSNVEVADFLVSLGAKVKVFNNFGTYPKTDYFRNHQKSMVKWFNAKMEEMGEVFDDGFTTFEKENEQ